MAGFFKFIVGCMMVAIIGILGINLDLLPGSAASARDKLQARILETLQGKDVAWATIEIEGQKIILTGMAPSAEARDNLVATLNNTTGGGGPVMGGVTSVDASSVTLDDGPPVVSPFTWSAMLLSDEVFLSGYTPSQTAKDTVLQLTAMRFPEKVITGNLTIASGAPPEDEWISAVSISLQAIAGLEEGAVEASDNKILISGVAASETHAAAAQVYLSALPETVSAATDLRIATPPESAPQVAAEEVAAEEVAADEVSTGESEAEHCRSQLDRAIGAIVISFDSNRASINSDSAGRLRDMAASLADCPQFTLEIVGHTDSSGSESRNQRLSQSRADAVAAILQAAGIDATRLSARGVGASQPVASNASARGRAQNRRIELNLMPVTD